MEYGIVYELVGPDGTRAAFGNTNAVLTDPDMVGVLADEGITGLDSPDVREVAQEIAGGDGGIHYPFLRGRRPVAINGVLWQADEDIASVNARERKLSKAAGLADSQLNVIGGGIDSDSILAWTNTGLPKRRLAVRPQQPARYTGRRPRNFLVALVCADWRILSDALHSDGPTSFGTARTINNAGDVLATPRFVINGPHTTPGATLQIKNNTTGLFLTFKTGFALSAAQQLIVDFAPPYPSALRDGLDVYGQIDYGNTSWWGLVPGNNSVQVNGVSTGNWTVTWRDAWVT